MQQDSRQDRVEAIVDRLIGPPTRNALSLDPVWDGPRLDTSKPNIHDSKKDFLRERDAIASLIENLKLAIAGLLDSKDDVQHQDMVHRLQVAVDTGARKPQEFDDLETAHGLALRNVVQTGFFTTPNS